MWHTPERILRLLALLQRRRDWNAEQLAAELDVTPRTVRRDIARLRDLGYPIAAVHGVGGGYAMEPGATLPPLMFDTDEAVAVLIALRDLADHAEAGAVDGTLSALDKLARMMPPRLHSTVQALSAHTSSVDLGQVIGAAADPVDVDTLVLLARACREQRRVVCTHRARSRDATSRRIEPLHLIRTMGHWYLVAYCLDATDWRTFRVDRLTETVLTSEPSHARTRTPPAADLAEYVTTQVSTAYRRINGTVRVHAPASQVARWVQPAWGTVTEESPSTCLVNAGADSYAAMARWLLLVGVPLTVIDPPQLRAAFADLAAHASAIAGDPTSVAVGHASEG
jgi:predicted DNA-binding transcriptional regulator YafY